jgi:alpha-galactosidase
MLDLLRPPDAVTAYRSQTEPLPLQRTGDEWRGAGVTVETRATRSQVQVTLAAPGVPVARIHLRWRQPVDPSLVLLGDAWERSYGDLCWRGMVPERVMPWYFATLAGQTCHCYGVRTQAGSMCFWQIDPEGASLWLDTSNGGLGVELGARTLSAATIVTRKGEPQEPAFIAVSAFCRQMCAAPSQAARPVYGFNDWYYAYGNNTAQRILADTDFLAELSVGNAVRPFSVIDDGWKNTAAFPDMAGLAARIKERKVRPGIWIRPLQAAPGTKPNLLLPDARYGDRRERYAETAYDPTIPEARERVLAKVRQVVGWGYELVKHDFSTYELLGRWGFEMGAEPTVPGWSLHDRSRTNAEVILDLYRGIRESCASQTLVLGCNAVGHLGQGLFDLQRTGDDTSGRQWERTRRMGVNTLAFRLPQHGAFFVQDADCVGISPEVPWAKNSQWLDVLARSGTAVFVSPGEGALGPEQSAAMRAAFAMTAAGGAAARPRSWFEETTPGDWAEARTGGHLLLHYDWCGPEGASPFPA